MSGIGILLLAAALASTVVPAEAKGQRGKASRGSYSAAKAAPASVAPRAQAARRSLLDHPGQAQPSASLAQTIRNRESGPGWVGTAFLIALLSGGGLSASDRSWLEARIASMANDGGDDNAAPVLLGPVAPPIQFHFDGLRDRYVTGDSIAVRVSATRAGTALPVSCIDPVSRRELVGEGLHLSWAPAAAGVDLLACSAGGYSERRLVRVEG